MFRLVSSLVLLVAAGAATGSTTRAQAPREIAVLRAERCPGHCRLLERAARARRAGRPEPALVADLETSAERACAPLREWIERRGGEVHRVLFCPPALVFSLPERAGEELADHPLVAVVHPDRRLEPHIRRATGANNHNADLVQQNLGLTGQGVVIGLLDTGLPLNFQGGGGPHPAFLDAAGRSRVVLTRDIAGAGSVDDGNGHGTLVGGIAAGRNWSTDPRADDGFAPDSGLAVYRITADNSTNATTADLALGYQTALADRLAGLALGVVNCSFEGSSDPTAADQLALDALALYGDVLVVTSAGNDGALPQPSLESQATLNGLATGAVSPDQHVVSGFSSRGPMAGDGNRTFPHLVAVGEGITSVPRASTGVAADNQGTSFAAPMVAGTAALVRQARPDFGFQDVKAVILNNTMDIAAANPGLGPHDYGTGLLRADLAVQGALEAVVGPPPTAGYHPRLLRDVLRTGSALKSYSVTLQRGRDYAATLVWSRDPLGQPGLDDLDLWVTGPGGDLVAVSASPSNLYEKVTFPAAAGGDYSFSVRGGLAQPAVGFSLIVALERGGVPRAGAFATLGRGCTGSGGDPAGGLVLPPQGARAFGNHRTQIPLTTTPSVMQQAFDSRWLSTPRTIRGLAFRRARDQGDAPTWSPDLEVRMGYTRQNPVALQLNLASNPVPGSMVTVLPRAVRVQNGIARAPESPRRFDHVMPLATPFSYDPARGHLLLEVTLFGNGRPAGETVPCWFDALRGPGFGRVIGAGVPPILVLPDPSMIVVSLLDDALPPATPRLTWEGVPALGGTFSAVLRDGLPGSFAVLGHGGSAARWGALPLPLDLSMAGAPGCTIYAAGDALLAVPIDAAGQARVDMVVPPSASLAGAVFFQQFGVLDPAANALGLVLTAAGFGFVGG